MSYKSTLLLLAGLAILDCSSVVLAFDPNDAKDVAARPIRLAQKNPNCLKWEMIKTCVEWEIDKVPVRVEHEVTPKHGVRASKRDPEHNIVVTIEPTQKKCKRWKETASCMSWRGQPDR